MLKKDMKNTSQKYNDSNLLPYYQKLSLKDKFDKDAKWIADCVNHIDRSSNYTDVDYQTKLDINYAIAKGRGKEGINQAIKSRKGIISDDDKSLLQDTYFDILSPIYKAMAGEQQKRTLDARAFDISGYNQNMIKKKKEEYYQDWTQSNIITPLKDKTTQKILQKHNITNPQDLSPEEQQQVQSEIEQDLKFNTPKDIDSFMNNDYKSPSETMIQEMLNWYLTHFDLKFKTDESFKHYILSGRQVVYQTIEKNKPICKIINPKGFSYFSKDNTFFIDEGEWWRFEEGVSYIELVGSLPMNDKIIDELHKVAMTYGANVDNYARRNFRGETKFGVNEKVAEINTRTNGSFVNSFPEDLLTRRGQEFIGSINSIFGGSYAGDNLIRKANICFKSYDKVFLVERYNTKKDDIDYYWVGENYVKNPELDKKVTEYWAPAFYQADKIGAESNIVFNKKRCEFQNRNVNDPFDVVPPYTGVEYSRLFNNSKPIAPIDFGKNSQAEYNKIKKKIREHDKRNIGRVFAVPESFIPEDWSMEKFVTFIKNTGIVPLNENQGSLNPAISAQILKSIDMTTNDYITSNLNRAEFVKREAEAAMSYSPSTLGQAPASITATNNQQNIIQGSYKTEDIFSLHNVFINRLLSNGMLMLKNALLLNKELRNAILSIPSLATLKIDDELLFNSIPYIKVLNTTDEVNAIKDIQNLMQPMIQNGVIKSFSEVMEIRFKKNSADLMNVAKEAERKAKIAQEEAIKREQENLEKDRQANIQMNKDKIALEKEKFLMQEETKRYIADKAHDQWLAQTDADGNKIPDSVQSTLIKAEVDKLKIESNEKIASEKLEANKNLINKNHIKK